MIERPKHKLIYIEWQDAISAPGTWRNLESSLEFGESGDSLVCQTGFLLKETDKYILIASKVLPGDEFGEALYGHVLKIPTTWIRKRRVIRGVYP